MTVQISITADGTKDDVVDFIRSIAEQIDAGETHGSTSDGRSWEFDDYADEEQDVRAAAWEG
jgi:hypothetical protein